MSNVTEDLSLALANNYIGEDRINPTVISDLICRMYRGGYLRTLHLYYYGELTDELRKRFGYQT